MGLAFTAVIGVVACNSSARSETSAADVPAAAVVATSRGDIAHVLNLAGQVQPYQVVDVHAKVSGYIKHIYVDIGEKVRAGETLAILEVPELNAQLKGTVSEFARSKDVMAALDDVLGLDRQMTYELVEDNASRQPPPPDLTNSLSSNSGSGPFCRH